VDVNKLGLPPLYPTHAASLATFEVNGAVGISVTCLPVDPFADATTPAMPLVKGVAKEAGGREIAGMLCASKL
jgi:hypothetical protein